MKRNLIIGGVLAAVILVGFFVVPSLLPGGQENAGSILQTEPLAVGELTAYVGATGTVRSSQNAVLNWQTSGTVASVLAGKGDVVTSGTVLAELEQTSLSQNIILAQSDLISAQQALEDVLNSGEARANAQLALVQAQQDLEDAEEDSQSKQYQRAGQNTIDLSRADLILAEDNLDDAESIYDQNDDRSQDDPIYAAALSQLANARKTRDQAYYNYQYVAGLPDPLDISEVEAELSLAQEKLLAAEREWNRLKDGPDPEDIAAAQNRVTAAEATLNLARLTAPFDGTLTEISVDRGDVVNTGTRAFRLDDLSRLLVDVDVSEVDINSVEIGQPATLTFDAIPGKEYTGVVDDVAAVGSDASGAVNFTVTIQITDIDEAVRPGMTAAVNIAVQKLENALLVPNRSVRTLDGQRVIYIVKNNQSVAVPITLGASSNTYSEILEGGAQAGDLVVLNPSSIQQISAPDPGNLPNPGNSNQSPF